MRMPVLALKRKQWEPFAFASPSLVLIGFVILFPLAYSFYLSFQNYDLSVGSDYDGADVPRDLRDAAHLPALFRAFERRGWADDRIERVANGNFRRVLRAVWRA